MVPHAHRGGGRGTSRVPGEVKFCCFLDTEVVAAVRPSVHVSLKLWKWFLNGEVNKRSQRYLEEKRPSYMSVVWVSLCASGRHPFGLLPRMSFAL